MVQLEASEHGTVPIGQLHVFMHNRPVDSVIGLDWSVSKRACCSETDRGRAKEGKIHFILSEITDKRLA